MKLFFDTETTGKAYFHLPLDHESQPRLVQLAAILADNHDNEIATINLIIKPAGFEIPAEASNIHGITTEIANEKGMALNEVLDVFLWLCDKSKLIVGHNIEYDIFVIRSELTKCYAEPTIPTSLYCTMKNSTDIVKLPSLYGNRYKWPKLQEVHKFAFGKEFDGAHDAMADIRATKRVYEWLQNQNAGAQ